MRSAIFLYLYFHLQSPPPARRNRDGASVSRGHEDRLDADEATPFVAWHDSGAVLLGPRVPHVQMARPFALDDDLAPKGGVVQEERRTMVFYEAPHRLMALLEAMINAFGPERFACACRELTKLHEEKIRGTLGSISAHFSEHEPRGEFTLIVAGAHEKEQEPIDETDLEKQFQELLAEGLTRRQAAKKLASAYGLKAADIYGLGLED